MNFYKIAGRITAITSGFLGNTLGFRNIQDYNVRYAKDVKEINIEMKDGRIAKIVYLEPGQKYQIIKDEPTD